MKTPEQRSSSSSSERSSIDEKPAVQRNGVGLLSTKYRTFRISSHNEGVMQVRLIRNDSWTKTD